MSKVGDRVGAVLSAKDGVVRFLGYGVYVGDDIPTEAVGFFAELGREAGIENPKIKLDNGEVVYGCECWWGSESVVKKQVSTWIESGLDLTHVSVADFRAEYNLAKKDDEDGGGE